jgi:hypothetical protein
MKYEYSAIIASPPGHQHKSVRAKSNMPRLKVTGTGVDHMTKETRPEPHQNCRFRHSAPVGFHMPEPGPVYVVLYFGIRGSRFRRTVLY